MSEEEIRDQINLMYDAADKRREEARANTEDRNERMQARAEARGINEAASMLARALDVAKAKR